MGPGSTTDTNPATGATNGDECDRVKRRLGITGIAEEEEESDKTGIEEPVEEAERADESNVFLALCRRLTDINVD